MLFAFDSFPIPGKKSRKFGERKFLNPMGSKWTRQKIRITIPVEKLNLSPTQ
jgi:hypothetical protein